MAAGMWVYFAPDSKELSTFFGRPVPRIADLVLVSLENTLVVRAYGMTQLTPENKPTPRRTRNIQLLRQRSGFA